MNSNDLHVLRYKHGLNTVVCYSDRSQPLFMYPVYLLHVDNG